MTVDVVQVFDTKRCSCGVPSFWVFKCVFEMVIYIPLRTRRLHMSDNSSENLGETMPCCMSNHVTCTQRSLAQFLHCIIFYWGGRVPQPSVSTYMCIANKLYNYAPIMTLITNCDCHSHIGSAMVVYYESYNNEISTQIANIYFLYKTSYKPNAYQ